jgi:hypothetical protein
MTCPHVSQGMKKTISSHAHARESTQKVQPSGSIMLQQLDGPSEHYQQGRPSNAMNSFSQPTSLTRAQPYHQPRTQHHQTNHRTTSQVAPPQQTHTPKNAVTEILPYCTTEPPLGQDQGIALSDVVGSIRELVLLALGAAGGDVDSVGRMEDAVGPEITKNIVEFFAEEWEVE